ncbi:MAG: ABC transporter permease [Truepera sp.]|nr:ABC transporter permease [Truepera sp.]
MSRLVWFLARKHIRRRALQSTLTVAGVAVGVMVLITALSLTNGFIDELISSTLRATPHITLRSFGLGATPDLPQDAALLAALQQRPEVVAASPFVLTQGLLSRRADRERDIGARTGFVQLFGIAPTHAQVLELDILQETVSPLQEGTGIVLGGSLARSLGVGRGDMLLFVDINQRREFFTVLGTFSVGNELIDSVTAFVALEQLQSFLGAPGMISGVHLRVADPALASTVAQVLSQHFGLFATTWQAIFSTLIEQLNLQRALISVVVFLIVLVAAMGIANILILTVAEKTEEIAILRALGASQRQILSVFTLEALLLGGLGTLLGATLGLGLSLYFKFQPFPLPGDLYFITRLPVELRAWDFIWVCSLSIITSVVAGLAPARRASSLDPAKILR